MLWWVVVRRDLKITVKIIIVAQIVRNRMNTQSSVLFSKHFSRAILYTHINPKSIEYFYTVEYSPLVVMKSM